MAVFENGKLVLITAEDLRDTLIFLDSDESINMNSRLSCLGTRTIERLIQNDRADVRFHTYDGTVQTPDEAYTVRATGAASEFIEAMIARQLDGPNDDEYFGIEVRELRDEIQPYEDRDAAVERAAAILAHS